MRKISERFFGNFEEKIVLFFNLFQKEMKEFYELLFAIKIKLNFHILTKNFHKGFCKFHHNNILSLYVDFG
ncbi:hypothetical protein [Chryseobacterium gambrini]|uniref:hypothetical protein n=1 Tax=Chryseobacterium gambrini TaxID=373672 RepID=UPI0022F3C8E4|nr:hypothetical protein [Chryseobacterium gambrini]WBX99517.1 hypothetical protein PE065_09750 [Chryseobacterium gambrini]